jgi:hypothetical protein
MRALAIALFYSVGTAIGGLLAPALFGALLQASAETGDRGWLVLGYLFGAGLMLTAAAVAWVLGVDAEGKALEDVAAPLTSEQHFPPRLAPA